MPAYRLDDPELDRVMRKMAAETAATWPTLSVEQRADLAPLLAPPVAPTKTRHRTVPPARQAA